MLSLIHPVASLRDRLAERGGAGQGLAEYALILALVAVLCVAGLSFLKDGITSVLSTLGNQL